jgi:hypothetical protein
METKKYLGLMFILLVGSFSLTTAQDVVNKKAKPYDTWVITSGSARTLKGTLYEVQDSSLSITNPYSNNFESFSYKDIDRVKVRRKKNVLKGAIIGGGIGLIIPFVVNPGSGKDSDLTPLVNTLMSVPFSLIGAGIGAGIGSLKITIPISGNRDHFKAYKNKLNYFAVNKNAAPVTSDFPELQNIQTKNISSAKRSNSLGSYEHESYFGIVSGPSFPMGDLNREVMINNRNIKAKSGYSSNVINIGYRLKGRLGISFAFFQNQYDAKSANPDEWWSVGGILAGPMYSYQLGRKFIFDLKPRIGYSSTGLNTDINTQFQGSGLALNPCLGFRYNFHRRWCAITEAGYFYSGQKIKNIGSKNIQSFNLGFGIGYRYK